MRLHPAPGPGTRRETNSNPRHSRKDQKNEQKLPKLRVNMWISSYQMGDQYSMVQIFEGKNKRGGPEITHGASDIR